MNITEFIKSIELREPAGVYESPTGKKIPVYVKGGPLSLFDLNEILDNKITTQRKEYRDLKNPKNFIRRKILPQLSTDNNLTQRYKALERFFDKGSILVIGAGDKIQYYKDLFPESNVITSDVHLQFEPDAVIDAHDLPYKDDSFDLVIAGQVLEHTLKPWLVATEIQRILKKGGIAQIETPMAFHWHSMPFDFFRFTFTGLRSLFRDCSLEEAIAPEGNGSLLAVTFNASIVNISTNRYIRQILMFTCRILFWWLKYTDVFYPRNSVRYFLNPKGICMTFKYDGTQRSDKELLEEFYKLKQL